MSQPDEERQTTPKSVDFEDEARQSSPGFLAELLEFIRHNKKWWLTPIIVVLIVLGLIIVVGGGSTPFIYTLF